MIEEKVVKFYPNLSKLSKDLKKFTRPRSMGASLRTEFFLNNVSMVGKNSGDNDHYYRCVVDHFDQLSPSISCAAAETRNIAHISTGSSDTERKCRRVAATDIHSM